MSGTNLQRIPVPAGEMTSFVAFTPIVDGVKRGNCFKQLHQIATVRRNQSLSLLSCAKRLGISIQEARRQEEPTTDLTLSQLMAWKEALDVPLSELIGPVENELEDPIRNRALMVKVMKSAKQIFQIAHESRIRYMATNLINQLVELMPELKSVSAWPDVGQSHESRGPGQAVFRRFDPEISRRMES